MEKSGWLRTRKQTNNENASVPVGGKPYPLSQGRAIVVPVKIPHAVAAESSFKILLTVVFSLTEKAKK